MHKHRRLFNLSLLLAAATAAHLLVTLGAPLSWAIVHPERLLGSSLTQREGGQAPPSLTGLFKAAPTCTSARP